MRQQQQTTVNDSLDSLLQTQLKKMACAQMPQQPLDLTDNIMADISRAEALSREKETASKCIEIKENKECMKMKPFVKSKKLLVATMVAALCLTTATCFAMGKIAGYAGGTHRVSDEYPSSAKIEKVLHAPADSIEKFSNGFAFTSYSVGKTSSYDENGNKMETLPEVALEYQNADQTWLVLNISPVFTGQTFDAPGATEIPYNDEIMFRYHNDHYRFVPVDYEISPEEQELMDANQLYISYGADEVDDCYMSGISWVKDGLCYHLGGKDLPLDQNDMVQMAKEIITQGAAR